MCHFILTYRFCHHEVEFWLACLAACVRHESWAATVNYYCPHCTEDSAFSHRQDCVAKMALGLEVSQPHRVFLESLGSEGAEGRGGFGLIDHVPRVDEFVAGCLGRQDGAADGERAVLEDFA